MLNIIPTLYEGYIVSVHRMVMENRPVDPGSIQGSHRPISFMRIKYAVAATILREGGSSPVFFSQIRPSVIPLWLRYRRIFCYNVTKTKSRGRWTLSSQLTAARVRKRVLFMSHNATSVRATPICTTCLLYTSPSPRDQRGSRMPSSA